MSVYLFPIVCGLAITFFILFIILLTLLRKNNQMRMSAIEEVVAEISADKDDKLDSIKKLLTALNLSEDKVNELSEKFIEKEKELYSIVIDAASGEAITNMSEIGDIFYDQLSLYSDNVTTVPEKIDLVQEEVTIVEQVEEEDDIPSVSTMTNEEDDDIVMASSAEDDDDDIGIVLGENDEVIINNKKPKAPAKEVEVIQSDPDDVEVVGTPSQSSSLNDSKLKLEIENLQQENKDLVKKEKDTRELLNTVLAEFGSMFNITRESVADMSIEDIRSLLDGEQ